MIEYFSHDYHARSDSRLLELRMHDNSMEGVGLYWCLVEILYENGGQIEESRIKSIAFELHSDCERIKSILEDFGLFYLDDGYYRSESADRRLEHRSEKSNSASRAANIKWERIRNEKLDANALRTESERYAIKEKKSKERKEIYKEKKVWKTDFEAYKKSLLDAFEQLKSNKPWLDKQQKFNPNLNILLSIEKGINNFWGTEAGWKNKKKANPEEIDWPATFAKTIDLNKVYLPKDEPTTNKADF
jgi:hypothetical protein